MNQFNSTSVENLLHFVTPRVIDLIERQELNGLGKTEKDVAILFVDIEGCTLLCEKLPPFEMNNLLETYFTLFFSPIQEYGGTVNEIMGDGFMVIFERGTYKENISAAVETSIHIKEITSQLRARKKFGPYDTQVNVGIHAGTAYVGLTKFKAKRWERWTYTASGPVTNIAARLCQLAKGGSILVSEEVARQAMDRYHLKQIGLHTLKNVSNPMQVFEVVDRRN